MVVRAPAARLLAGLLLAAAATAAGSTQPSEAGCVVDSPTELTVFYGNAVAVRLSPTGRRGCSARRGATDSTACSPRMGVRG